MKKRLIVALTFVLIITLLVVLPVSAGSVYGSGSYPRPTSTPYTTVSYSNQINDQSSTHWNGGYYDYTNPSTSMDLFGLNVWTTYVQCGSTIQYSTYVRYEVQNNSWMYRYNETSIGDGMAQVKVDCQGQTRTLHDYIQHYWQDGQGNSGDGGSLDYSQIG